MLNTAINRDFV